MAEILENIRRIGMFMIAAQTVIHFAAGKQYEKYMKIIAGVIILLQFVRPFVSHSDDILEQWQSEVENMMEQAGNQYDASQTEGKYYVNQPEGYASNYVEKTALRKIEEEIKCRLNETVSDAGYEVTEVAIDLTEAGNGAGATAFAGGYERDFRGIRIVMQERMNMQDFLQNENTHEMINIEEITIGLDKERNDDQADMGQDQELGTGFAGIEEGKEQNKEQGANLAEAGQDKVPGTDHAGTRETQAPAYEADMMAYRRLFAQRLGIAEDRVEVVCDGK